MTTNMQLFKLNPQSRYFPFYRNRVIIKPRCLLGLNPWSISALAVIDWIRMAAKTATDSKDAILFWPQSYPFPITRTVASKNRVEYFRR